MKAFKLSRIARNTFKYNFLRFSTRDESFINQLESAKRAVGKFYVDGQFLEALKSAVDIEDTVTMSSAKDTAFHAAALNNVGLLSYLIGDYDVARIKLTKALDMYDATMGGRSEQYASALANLGTYRLIN
jgi:hypothetical protein